MPNIPFLHRALSVLALSACLAGGAARLHAADLAIKDGQKIAFLGDSITAAGWGNPVGYVRLVIAGLQANDLKITPFPAGISGHKSDQMLARLQRDVLDKKPDWMTLSCGVNDVWHGAKGIPLDAYKTNITAILDRCEAAGVKVMILTATVIGEELDNENNQKLDPYNAFLRSLAKDRHCLLADLNADFHKALHASARPGRAFTSDGVHMNPSGDQLMAEGILRAFGLTGAQMKNARETWLDLPGVTMPATFNEAGKKLRASPKTTLRQRGKLQAIAAQRGQTLDQLLNGLYAAEVKSVIKPGGDYESLAALFEAKKEKEVQSALEQKLGKRIEELLKN